ncbi:MAG: NADH-quinone oxidoreductase subunit NuoE [Rhodospirillales bacterium]|nr:NADH-quinone oxidoreductase subunit NuoE [Rhodospirillales bacterium]MCW8970860.1 NADH-quinone oxidoreductase subunit NuoE [Rhodospirillales bacterium]
MTARTGEMGQPATFAFSESNLKEADRVIAKYPKGRQASAVMPLLDLAQRQNDGWLPRAAMDYIAEMLDMPPIKVYEVANFYTMYNLKPVGRNHVQICTNISCWIRGSDKVVKAAEETLGIGFGQTSDDGQFTLSEVECLGACVNAPMMQVNDDYFEDLDEKSAGKVFAALAKGESPAPGPQIDRTGCEPSGGLTTLKDQVAPPKAGKGK